MFRPSDKSKVSVFLDVLMLCVSRKVSYRRKKFRLFQSMGVDFSIPTEVINGILSMKRGTLSLLLHFTLQENFQLCSALFQFSLLFLICETTELKLNRLQMSVNFKKKISS